MGFVGVAATQSGWDNAIANMMCVVRGKMASFYNLKCSSPRRGSGVGAGDASAPPKF